MAATRGVEGIIAALFPELFRQLDTIELYGRMNGVTDWSVLTPAGEDEQDDVRLTVIGELTAALRDEVERGVEEFDSALIRAESFRFGGIE